MKTHISVVIPNWNGADMLKNCLQALQKQTLKAEIIVVDNGSDDGSLEMVKKHFPDVRLIRKSKNLGFAGGVNAGIRQALGVNRHYIALLNNDTGVDPSWLEELLREMDKDKSCGIVASKVIQKESGLIDNTGEHYSVWGIPFPRSRDRSATASNPGSHVFGSSGGSTLYRAKMLEDIGLFDEDFFAYYEDADMNWRAQLAGWKARYAEKAIVYHEIGGTSGRVSGFTTYQTFKNLPWVVLKNVPFGLLYKIVPRFILIYLMMLAKALFSKNFISAANGVLVSVVYTPKKLIQRYKIQKNKKASSQYLGSVLYEGLPPNSSFRKLASKVRRKSY